MNGIGDYLYVRSRGDAGEWQWHRYRVLRMTPQYVYVHEMPNARRWERDPDPDTWEPVTRLDGRRMDAADLPEARTYRLNRRDLEERGMTRGGTWSMGTYYVSTPEARS